jgi:hypothetical protein
MDRLDRMLALARTHVPRVRFANKADSALMRGVAVLVRPLNAEFATRYVTVVGDTVWLPRPVEAWPRDELAAILGHELVHMLDQQRYGLAFYASYSFPPAGRTTRAHWERRGYTVDLLLARERGGAAAVHQLAARLARLFAGPDYGYMWAGEAAAAAFLRPAVNGVLMGWTDAEAPFDAILASWRG